jgi:hypothetical protein
VAIAHLPAMRNRHHHARGRRRPPVLRVRPAMVRPAANPANAPASQHPPFAATAIKAATQAQAQTLSSQDHHGVSP